MCKIMEDMRNEAAREAAREAAIEAAQKSAREIAERMLRDGEMPLVQRFLNPHILSA